MTEIPCPGGGSVASLCNEFRDFKHKVDTYGGILINPNLNKVLLVQVNSFSWCILFLTNLILSVLWISFNESLLQSFNGHSWGFPKGKIEQKEQSPECAVREVSLYLFIYYYYLLFISFSFIFHVSRPWWMEA